jgi:hypothetical protein
MDWQELDARMYPDCCILLTVSTLGIQNDIWTSRISLEYHAIVTTNWKRMVLYLKVP